VPDQHSSWLHGLEPVMERRRAERRSAERRSGELPAGVAERRRGEDRRLRQRRESVGEHLRNALQVLLHATARREMPIEARHDISAAIRRVWLALQELERTPQAVERMIG
jgi:hypothetical protein